MNFIMKAYAENCLQKRCKELVKSINKTSDHARSGWIFLIIIELYLFVTIGCITHKSILYDSPLKVPMLGVEVPLVNFFVFAPLVLLIVYFGVIIQHWVLADKLNALNKMLSRMETTSEGRQRAMSIRLDISCYFVTYAVSGPARNRLQKMLMKFMAWITLVEIPTLILLLFQTIYLPAHDEFQTLVHQGEVLVCALFSLFALHVLGLKYAYIIAAFGQAVFSILIATVPDSALDRFSQHIYAVPVSDGLDSPFQIPGRKIFPLTKYFFETGYQDEKPHTARFMNRNLVVIDSPAEREQIYIEKEQLKNISGPILRNRNLRYAIFEGSNFVNADFIGADLTGASFRRSDLRSARFGCDRRQLDSKNIRSLKGNIDPVYDKTDYASHFSRSVVDKWGRPRPGAEGELGCTTLEFTDFSQANLGSAEFNSAIVKQSWMRNADVSRANFSDAVIYETDFTKSNLQRANFDNSVLIGAMFSDVKAQLISLKDARIILSDFRYASLDFSNLDGSLIVLTNASFSSLIGANLTGVGLYAVNFTRANVWNSGIFSVYQSRDSNFFGVRLQKPGGSWEDDAKVVLEKYLEKAVSDKRMRDIRIEGVQKSSEYSGRYKAEGDHCSNGDYKSCFVEYAKDLICTRGDFPFDIVLKSLLFARNAHPYKSKDNTNDEYIAYDVPGNENDSSEKRDYNEHHAPKYVYSGVYIAPPDVFVDILNMQDCTELMNIDNKSVDALKTLLKEHQKIYEGISKADESVPMFR
jgi:uncharacterized protein YjbI with pentapeptide repeats